MAKLCLLLFIFSILIFSSLAYGQITSLSVMQFTEQDGISHEGVLCMAQDSSGFIWFGARGGLGRFDGNKTILYYPSPGDSNALPAEVVYSMCITADDKICVGTEKDGLAVLEYTTQRFTSFQHNPIDSNSLSGNMVYGICERSGFFWAITESSHLNRLKLTEPKSAR